MKANSTLYLVYLLTVTKTTAKKTNHLLIICELCHNHYQRQAVTVAINVLDTASLYLKQAKVSKRDRSVVSNPFANLKLSSIGSV